MRSLSRSMRPAIVLVAAALMLIGGGTFALGASTSSTIAVCVKHRGGALYKAKKCGKHDRKLSLDQQGPTGQQGPQGNRGTQGIQGAQGPGATILTYNGPATAPPTPTPIGTLDGDTWSGDCVIISGGIETRALIETGDGSMVFSDSNIQDDNDVTPAVPTAGGFNYPAGTFSSPQTFITAAATSGSSGDTQTEITQTRPTAASFRLHLHTDKTANTCSLSIEGFPVTAGASAGASDVRPASRRLRAPVIP